MKVTKNPNLERLQLAVEQLEELSDQMVFVGGCATGLLITDEAAPVIRVTKDVDAIVQVVSKAEYYQLSKKLRGKGFKEDMSLPFLVSFPAILAPVAIMEVISTFPRRSRSAVRLRSHLARLNKKRPGTRPGLVQQGGAYQSPDMHGLGRS